MKFIFIIMLFLLNSCVFYKNSKVNTCNFKPYEYTSVNGRKLTGTVIDGIQVPIEIKRRFNNIYFLVGTKKEHFSTYSYNLCDDYALYKENCKWWYLTEDKKLNESLNDIDSICIFRDGLNRYIFNSSQKLIGIRVVSNKEIFIDYECDSIGNIISKNAYRIW